jgi:hypothetical protein
MRYYVALLITGLTAASAALGWDVSVTASYGACFVDGAPNAYMGPGGEEYKPEAKTSEPLAASVEASFGRLAVAVSYAHRYDLYGEAGKVHDFALVGRPLLWSSGIWELRGEAGVAVSRAPVPAAFMFGKEGPVYDWSAVVGANVDVRPLPWLYAGSGVSYRERPQVIKYLELYPDYGSVKSPAIDLTAHCLFVPWRYIRVGPSFQQIFYGPYDYYLSGGTNQNEGWVTGKETYAMATLGFVIPF